MVLLQSKDIFLNIAKLNTNNCEYDILEKNVDLVDYPDVLDGVYSFLNKMFIALYVTDKKLFLCIKLKKYAIDSYHKVELLQHDDGKVLIIKRFDIILEEIYYTIDYKINDNYITSYEDDEDYDFGLFLKNLLTDTTKINRFKSHRIKLSEGSK